MLRIFNNPQFDTDEWDKSWGLRYGIQTAICSHPTPAPTTDPTSDPTKDPTRDPTGLYYLSDKIGYILYVIFYIYSGSYN